MATVLIPLTQGKFATIDECDLPLVSGYSWHIYHKPDSHLWYATAWIRGSKHKKKITMHALIIGRSFVDHKDGNGLNNTRDNIRKCTQLQNLHNRRKLKSASSKFKGVYFRKNRPNKPWVAQIKHKRKKNLGAFTSEIEAAKAYDIAASKMFGEFARLNFAGELINV